MDFSKISLAGKVALVTGGSRGIGHASALAFADAGADVVLASRKLDDEEKAADEIRAKGRRSLAVACHVARMEDCKNLVEKAKAEFGRIDILLNNAGTNPYTGPIIDTEEWQWDVTMNVNLRGPFFLTLLVARLMKEQGGGNIINVASTAGLSGGSIYGVSKAGVISLTRGFAHEWGPYGIRVNAVAPGWIKTRFSQSGWGDPATAEKLIQGTALKRLGEAEDVAKVILFLASDLSSYVTGQVIPIAGG